MRKELVKRTSENYRTWIEIDSRAARKNYETFRKIVGPKVRLWSVVKSNAYGHGLLAFSKLASDLGVDGFCVDSLVEGLKLRADQPSGGGIKRPILVLGPTLPALYGEAAKNNIALTISNFDALKAVTSIVAKKATNPNRPPGFHIKVDTGMHRQGFYLEDLSKVVRLIGNWKLKIENSPLQGIYTHFASAKDVNYPTYTENQFQKFQKAIRIFERAGYKNLVKHCAATGATLISPKYHLNAVRLGIGLYGLWPSRELEVQLGRKIHLKPVLSWRAIVSEVKELAPHEYIGYDLSERVSRPTKIAILPLGYWHGFSRSLSGAGTLLVRDRLAKVLGRVSMDLTAVDITGIKCRPGDVATLIGWNREKYLGADEVAQKSGTIHYEFLTRLNPLIERIVM